MALASVFARFSADSTAQSPAKANFADFSNQQIWMALASDIFLVFFRFNSSISGKSQFCLFLNRSKPSAKR
tara:strand:- start:62 stop:274 length:213 start_codon:yes stop_codon:yes gene_type:complete